jgi:enoyl-CoA hydratase/carnithine racemase
MWPGQRQIVNRVYSSDKGRADVSDFETLEYEVSEKILTMWLNRPPVNAMTQQMFRELDRMFTAAEQWPDDIRAIILAGRGRIFCGGQDLNELADMSQADVYYVHRTVREVKWKIYECTLPEELLPYGAFLDVVPAEVLMDRAREACALMTRHSPVALRTAKAALNRVEYLPLKEGYEFEQGLTATLTSHPDSKEAARAFLEGRLGDYEPFRNDW